MMCGSWYEYLDTEEEKAEEYIDKKTPREVINLFKEEAEPHFEYIAETFSKTEAALCKKIVEEKEVSPDDPVAEMLLRRGYCIEDKERGVKPFSELFGQFLKKYFLR